MTQTTVLPGGAPPPSDRPAGLSRAQKVAAALVTAFVVSGAIALVTKDDPPPPPAPAAPSRASLVTQAAAACAVVKDQGYAWPQVDLVAKRLTQLVPPAADAAGWRTALERLDVSVQLERQAFEARADTTALSRLTAAREKARADATRAFAAAGIRACPGA